MPVDRFRSLARACTAAASRRSLAGALAGGLLALATLEHGADSPAKAKQKRNRKTKRQKPCPAARRCKQTCCPRGQTCRGGKCERPPDSTPPAVRVRRDLHGLAVGGPELAAFARGVAVMQGRPADTPTSWAFQAAFHAANCQHDTIHFLSWHRMFLYWFERIVRKASGDLDFALPYWNYSNPEQRVLPAPFRDQGNALYVAERSAAVNGGQRPDPDFDYVFDTAAAMATVSFTQTGEGTSFGGGAGTRGQLEQAPHNYVHNWIGGFMGSIPDAAKDPVFWLHHANIDRLWEAWPRLGEGRANPASGDFLTTSFGFYNENGGLVEMTGRQILDTVNQLGYRYDDQPAAGARAAAIAPEPSLAAAATGEVIIVGAKPVASDLTLGPRLAEIAIPMRESAGARSRAARKGRAGQVTLTLEGVAGGGVDGVTYEVHVDATSASPSPRDRSFVGAIGLFGLQPWDHPGHGRHTANMSFDVTRAVAAGGDEAAIVVTLVPATLTGADRLPGGTWATIERMVISVASGGAKAPQRMANPTRRQAPKDDGTPAARQQPARDDPAKVATKNRTDRRLRRPDADTPGASKQKQRSANQKRKPNRRPPESPAAPLTGAQGTAAVPGNKASTFSLDPVRGGADDGGHTHH